MRLAVVGHVEWVEFVRVERLPARGEIAHGTDGFEEPAGGGGVAAVQLARLAGESALFTALGDDELAGRSRERLGELGVGVHAATRRGAATRRALTQVDMAGERTITTIGERLAPRREDPLPWEQLETADGAYFTAGDADALRAARGARVLVATPRAGAVLRDARVEIDALVFSGDDEDERSAAQDLQPLPSLLVATQGAGGGRYTSGGSSGRWEATEAPGPIADSYGAGDSFAATILWALANGEGTDQAIAVAARAGAICATGRGPYTRQLTAVDL